MAGFRSDNIKGEIDLHAKIMHALEKYTYDVSEKVDEAAEECAKGAKDDLRKNSPKRSGFYSFCWSVKNIRGMEADASTHIVHSKNYQKTHLLENGHAGPYGKGFVSPRVHIAPVEKKWTEEFVKKCEEACEG